MLIMGHLHLQYILTLGMELMLADCLRLAPVNQQECIVCLCFVLYLLPVNVQRDTCLTVVVNEFE